MKYLSELGFIEKRDKIVVSSRSIASNFGRNHKDVLRAIENANCSDDFRRRNFAPSYYINEQNKKQPELLLTRDGFAFTIMGFTGSKAAEFKEKYIETFNKMEAALRERQTTEWKQVRQDGKLIRRVETDALALLKQYAEDQREGKPYNHIYVNYTKLVNRAVGVETGGRLQATKEQLRFIIMLEDMIEKTVLEEMDKNVFFKDIYRKCSEKVDVITDIFYLKDRFLLQ